MNATTLSIPEKLELVGFDNEHLCWLSEQDARELVRKGKVDILGTGTKIRKLKARKPPEPGERLRLIGSDYRPTKYSHNHETRDNPENCWTLVKLPKPTHPVFLRVANDIGGVRKLRKVGTVVELDGVLHAVRFRRQSDPRRGRLDRAA